MNKYSLAFFCSVLCLFLFFSCKKINTSTELGSELIPAVDNIHTFEVSLATNTDNHLFNDSTKLAYTDQVAVGQLNDPEFGATNANLYFNLSYQAYGRYPFVSIDSVIHVDSVVLSLSYKGGYGDTMLPQTVALYEIQQGTDFNDTAGYKFNDYSREPSVSSLLATQSFIPARLADSIRIGQKPLDTSKTANVLRINLNNSFATRFLGYDTSATSGHGAFANDSLFNTFFKGLALKSQSGNALSYFDLSNINGTKLTFYFRAGTDTTSIDFVHKQQLHITGSTAFTAVGAQANIIRRTPSGNYLAYLNNNLPLDDKIYLQTTPGSYASIVIPGLNTLTNKVVHRAELVITKLPSAGEITFTPPARLFLDHVNGKAAPADTAFIMDKDLGVSSAGSVDFFTFGGTLHSDNTYRINISRYIQGVITRHDTNDTLRLYAPLHSTLFAPSVNSKISVSPLLQVANGRVVLAGGNYADPAARLRLRIVYSDL